MRLPFGRHVCSVEQVHGSERAYQIWQACVQRWRAHVSGRDYHAQPCVQRCRGAHERARLGVCAALSGRGRAYHLAGMRAVPSRSAGSMGISVRLKSAAFITL